MAGVLVIGGAGRTGRRVVDRLSAAGHRVTVASRRPGRSEGNVETVSLDLAAGFDPAVFAGLVSDSRHVGVD